MITGIFLSVFDHSRCEGGTPKKALLGNQTLPDVSLHVSSVFPRCSLHLYFRSDRVRLDLGCWGHAHDVLFVRLSRSKLGEDETIPGEYQGAREARRSTAKVGQRSPQLETQVC